MSYFMQYYGTSVFRVWSVVSRLICEATNPTIHNCSFLNIYAAVSPCVHRHILSSCGIIVTGRCFHATSAPGASRTLLHSDSPICRGNCVELVVSRDSILGWTFQTPLYFCDTRRVWTKLRGIHSSFVHHTLFQAAPSLIYVHEWDAICHKNLWFASLRCIVILSMPGDASMRHGRYLFQAAWRVCCATNSSFIFRAIPDTRGWVRNSAARFCSKMSEVLLFRD